MYAKNGRYGPYVQWGTADDPPPGLDKPKMSSLFKTMILERITVDDADGAAAAAAHARRRPGRRRADRRQQRPLRAVRPEGQGLPHRSTTRSSCSRSRSTRRSQIFAQPKVYKRGGGNMAAKGPLREFGTDPVSERPVVAKDGRFGVYVTDGETNASIGKGDRLEAMTPERAYELLAIRREQVAAKGGDPHPNGRSAGRPRKR